MQKNKLTGVAAAVALALGASSAARAETDPYTLAVQETISHDNNVFRTPDGHGVVPHDWISTTSLMASLDQPISRERLKLNGEFDINRFRNQHSLNSTAHSVAGELDWSTVGNLFGEVGGSQTRQLYRYALDNGVSVTDEANIENQGQAFVRAHLGVVTRWTIDAAASYYDRTFSAEPYQFNDLRHWDYSLGTRYQDTPDLTWSLSAKRTRGDYANLDDDYTRNDVTAGVAYAPTGATTLFAQVGLARESHSLTTLRDTHNWTTNVQWRWTPTGRTSFSLSAKRDNETGSSEQSSFLGQNTVADTDARLRTAFSATVNYEVSAKILGNASLGYTKRHLDTSLQLGGLPLAPQYGSDHLYTAGLGLTWQPTRSIQLACNASRERRGVEGNTQGLTYAYSDTTVACTGQFAFN